MSHQLKDDSSNDTIASLLPKCKPFLDNLEKIIHSSGPIGKMDGPLFMALGVLSLDLQDKICKAGIHDLLIQSGRFLISDSISLNLSDQRLSELNPHASAYNPSLLTSLNPNAKEYCPSITVPNGDARDEEADESTFCDNWESLFDESEQDHSVAKVEPLSSSSIPLSSGIDTIAVTSINGLVSEAMLPLHNPPASERKQSFPSLVPYSKALHISGKDTFGEIPLCSSGTTSVLKANTWKPTEKDVFLINENHKLGAYLPESSADVSSSLILEPLPVNSIDSLAGGDSSDSATHNLLAPLNGINESSKSDTKSNLYSSFRMPHITFSDADSNFPTNKSLPLSLANSLDEMLESPSQNISLILSRYDHHDKSKIIKRVCQILGLDNLGKKTRDVEIQINCLVPFDNKKVQVQPLCNHFGAQVEDLDFAKLKKYKESLHLWTSDVEKYMARIKDMYNELQMYVTKAKDEDSDGRDKLKNEILDFKIKNLKLKEENDTLEERCRAQLLLLNDTSSKLREMEQKVSNLEAQVTNAQEEVSHQKLKHEGHYRSYLEMFMLVIDSAYKLNLEKAVNLEKTWETLLQKIQRLNLVKKDPLFSEKLKDIQNYLNLLNDYKAQLEETKNSLKAQFEKESLSGFYQDIRAFNSFPSPPHDIDDLERLLCRPRSPQIDAPKVAAKMPPGFGSGPSSLVDFPLVNSTFPLPPSYNLLIKESTPKETTHISSLPKIYDPLSDAATHLSLPRETPEVSALRRVESNETLASTADSAYSAPINSHPNIYHKIISLIKNAKPELRQAEIISYLKRFKSNNNNRLKGLKIETIVKGVIDLINAETS